MHSRTGVFGSFAVVLFAARASAEVVDRPAGELVVFVRGIDACEREKLLVDQAVAVSDDGSLKFFAGGEVAGTEGMPPLEFGTRVTGRLADREGALKSLTLRVEFTRRLDGGAGETPVVRGEIVALRTLVEPGRTVRVDCGGNRRCELRLERTPK